MKDLRNLSQIDLPAFTMNRERQYAVLHALQLAIEAAIEIGTHICSSDSLGVPGSYAETFDVLQRNGIVGANLATRLRGMARFRNRIVHIYWEVDLGEVHAILQNRLGDFEEYLAAVERYLEPA